MSVTILLAASVCLVITGMGLMALVTMRMHKWPDLTLDLIFAAAVSAHVAAFLLSLMAAYRAGVFS